MELKNIMPNAEQASVIESVFDMKESLKKQRKNLENMLAVVDNFEFDISLMEGYIAHGHFEFLSDESWRETLREATCRFLTGLEFLYWNTESSPMGSFVDKEIEAGKELSDALNNSVFATVFCGSLYIKMPLLLPKYKRIKRSGKSGFYSDYGHFFVYELERKLKQIEDKIPQFADKNVNVLAVYNEKRIAIPDADNLDTKKAIDTITDFLPGGDTGTHCSFSMANIKTNELPEGTYFTISEGFAKPPDLAENLGRLKSLWVV